jgi:glutathione S-transferase
MNVEPILYGAPYSVYVRTVRLVLEEKGVAYRLVPVDVFAEGGVPADHFDRHPFGRIPAFEYRGFQLYETGAITRYVDEAFAGPSLQPGSAEDRAKMNQVISMIDSYIYRTLIWDIYVERISNPQQGCAPDEARIAAALPLARICLLALERIMGKGPFLAGAALTLADLHAAPIFAYFTQTPEADLLLEPHAFLRSWWIMMKYRANMVSTVVTTDKALLE